MVSFIFLFFAASFASSFVGAVPFNNLLTRQNSNDSFALSNAQLAQQLNLAAQTAQVGDPCPTDGVPSCIGTGVSQCLNNQLLSPQPCGQDTQCVALPVVGQAGAIITCDTLSDAIMRITSTGATGGLTGGDNINVDSIGAETSAIGNIPGAIPAVPKFIALAGVTWQEHSLRYQDHEQLWQHCQIKILTAAIWFSPSYCVVMAVLSIMQNVHFEGLSIVSDEITKPQSR